MNNDIEVNKYKEIFENVKNEILKSQYRAMQFVNKELIFMYWNIGKIILANSEWGNKFIDNLSIDLKLEFPNSTGFSVRNLKYMRKFAEEYNNFEKVNDVTFMAAFLVKVASGNLRQLLEQSELQMSYAEALTKT